MAITANASIGGAQTKTTGTTLTWTLVRDVAENDLVVVWYVGGTSVSSANIGGHALTLLNEIASGTAAKLRVMYLIAPAGGLATGETVTINVASSAARAGFGQSFSGVDTASPLVAQSTGTTGSNALPLSDTFTPAAVGNLMIGAVGVNRTTADGNPANPLPAWDGYINTTWNSNPVNSMYVSRYGTSGSGATSNRYVYGNYDLLDDTNSDQYGTGIPTAGTWVCKVAEFKAAIDTTPISASDSGTGADTSSSPAAAIAGSDAGVGAEAVTDRAIVKADAGTGADTAIPAASLTGSPETGTAAESAAVSVPIAAADAGTGADSSQAPTAALAGTDSGAGADAQGRIGLASADAGGGADASASIGQATSDAGAAAEASRIGLASSDAGAGADSASSAAAIAGTAEAGTGADAQGRIGVAASDAGAGADSAAMGAGLGASDAASAADVASSVGLASSDAGVGADPTPVVDKGGGDQSIAAFDSGAGADAAQELVVAVTASDAGAGAEAASLAASLAGTDAGAGADSQPGPGLTTSDAGSGQESAALAAAGSSAEAAIATEAAALAAALSVSDAGAAGEQATKTEDITQVGAFDAGTGADQASNIEIHTEDGSQGGGYDKLIITYDRAYSVEDVVTDRALTVSDVAHAFFARYLEAPLADPFFRHRPIVAVSLYADLIERYGPVDGRRIYYEMEAQGKGPFGPGKKYAGSQPQPRAVEVTGIPPAQRN